MNFLYFVFVSLIWVSTQVQYSEPNNIHHGDSPVLMQTGVGGPTDPPNTQESQETPSTAPENTDSTTEPMTEEKALDICEKLLSCRQASQPDEKSGKYVCSMPVNDNPCFDDCKYAVMDKQCDRNATCILGELRNSCKCDKDRYKHGFSCKVTNTTRTTQEEEEAIHTGVCRQMDSCNQDAICDADGDCVCSGSSKNGIACKDKCRQDVIDSGTWYSERLYIRTMVSDECVCKKNYSSPKVPCKVTESPPVVTTTTTEAEDQQEEATKPPTVTAQDGGIQGGWLTETETNTEWLLSSLKNMQYAAWHIFKNEVPNVRYGMDRYPGYPPDPPGETADSPPTATENNHGDQGEFNGNENNNDGDSDSDGESHD